MSEKLQQLHLNAINKSKCCDEVIENNAASKSAEITKDVAIKFAEFVATYSDKNRNVYGNMLHAKSKYDGAETTEQLFEEFLKQYNGTIK